uniref:CAAX prenyl protease 2 n=1 Tax=Hirondellea gigas TaxID=1518452 RepID=A0A6A7G8T5_9CRUS
MFPCWREVLLCVSLSVLYVASLYIWDASKGRDHPSTIKKRCISVAVMTIISPIFLKFTVSPEAFTQYGYPIEEFSLPEVMGLRWAGLLNAVLFPLMLTAILYTGPIVFWMTHEHAPILLDPRYWLRQVTNTVWLRNQVVAPFSEEWTFRACLLPMLLQCMSPLTALFVAPLFFGLAHFHHAVERLKLGFPWVAVLLGTLFHCLFTSVFGIYSAYLFMKTGHFTAAFIAHAFCNLMGMPDVTELLELPVRQRCTHFLVHVLGIIMWYFALPSTTQSCWFDTRINYLPDL